jgi:hypothetical protein
MNSEKSNFIINLNNSEDKEPTAEIVESFEKV